MSNQQKLDAAVTRSLAADVAVKLAQYRLRVGAVELVMANRPADLGITRERMAEGRY